METTTINLTERQSVFAEHAVDAVVTEFTEQHDSRAIEDLPPLPVLEGSILTIPSHAGIIGSLLWRLEEDSPLSDDGPARPAIALASKIRAVTGFSGLSY